MFKDKLKNWSLNQSE